MTHSETRLDATVYGLALIRTVALPLNLDRSVRKLPELPALFGVDLDLLSLYFAVGACPRDRELDAFAAGILEHHRIGLSSVRQTRTRRHADHRFTGLNKNIPS